MSSENKEQSVAAHFVEVLDLHGWFGRDVVIPNRQ